MVTVEVDLACVESRLAAGELSCPSCPDGVLARWGFARSRRAFHPRNCFELQRPARLQQPGGPLRGLEVL